MECFIICKCLQTKVSEPETTVSLRSVLKYRLHAVLQRAEANTVKSSDHLVITFYRFHIFDTNCGNTGAAYIFDNELPFQGGINCLNLHVTECISSRKFQFYRKDIYMNKFFLNPATADPSVIIFGILCDFFCNLCKFQSEKCRCILRTPYRV